MANLERSGRPQPNGVGSSTSSAASPGPRKVAASPGPRQVAVASGDRSKAAHSYNRRSELPEELKDSEEARAVCVQVLGRELAEAEAGLLQADSQADSRQERASGVRH